MPRVRRSPPRGFEVRAASRAATGDLATFDRWDDLLAGVDCVVHLANLAHVAAAQIARARELNVEATARLAQAAAERGVRRFIYLSSVKAEPGEAREDPYGALKAEAEAQLAADRRHRARGAAPAAGLRPGREGELSSR